MKLFIMKLVCLYISINNREFINVTHNLYENFEILICYNNVMNKSISMDEY
jgi:hypothetical protein